MFFDIIECFLIDLYRVCHHRSCEGNDEVLTLLKRLWLCYTDLYYARGAQGVLPMRVEECDQSVGSPVSDAIVRSCCGRLQLGVPHWTTSVDYRKWLIIDPTFCGSRFSNGSLLAIEDFACFTGIVPILWLLVLY